MPSVSTMLLNSLVMTGEKSIGDTFTDASESGYYLSRLNSLMDSWSNESMMIYALSQTSFALTNSVGEYSIGNGATFNMTRPTEIVNPCFIRDSSGYDSPLMLINAETYGRIVLKSTDGTYPQVLFYDSGYSATSTATVKLWPEPQSNLTLFINTLQPLQTFSTVSVSVQLPPGYQRAIETNFAIEVAPGFVTLDKEILKIAKDSKAAIKGTNATAPIMRLDYGVGPRSNILTGP